MTFLTFLKRRDIAATLASLLISPAVGMIYLGRFGYAGLYFVLTLLIFPLQMENPIHFMNYLPIILKTIGTFHCYRIAETELREPPKERPPGYLRLRLIGFFLWAVSSAAWMFFTLMFVQPFINASSSMLPAFTKEQPLVADKFIYARREPERGDAIIFKRADNGDMHLKRIIGMPGEQVQIKEGIVYINGKALPQEKLENGQYRETLPEGTPLLILRERSNDAPNNTRIYTIPENGYFVMGDNRDNSHDSRFNDIGIIPRANIIGAVIPTKEEATRP